MKNKVFIGKMNSGKTKSIFKSVDKLIDNNESLFILDSKYEYTNKYYDLLKNRDYNIKIIDLRSLSNSDTFNPLLLPYELYKEEKSDLYLEILEKVIKYVVQDETSIDPFWQNTAADLITGIVLTLFYRGKKEEINFSSVVEIINSKALKEYFEEYKNTPAIKYVDAAINAPIETFGGIRSVALQKLRLYTTRENLSRFLSATSFNYKEFIDKKSAIFFVNYDSTSVFNNLVNAFIGELYMYLENNIKTNFNFILDNFDSLGYIYDFKEMLSSANSHNISFIIGTRDMPEVESKYHKLDSIADMIDANDEATYSGESIKYHNNLVDNVSVIDLSKLIDTKK